MICEIKALRSSVPRVLVVEDEPLIRFAIADALREEGVSVIEAATGDEAWDHLQIDGDIDIIFTDHRMPGTLSGAELAVRAKESWPGIIVVLTSGDFDGKGFHGKVLRKPYSMIEVARDLAKMARSRRRMSNG